MEEELRLGRRTSEATGACLVRQRLTSREHSPVRQNVFSSCLPRSTSSRSRSSGYLKGGVVYYLDEVVPHWISPLSRRPSSTTSIRIAFGKSLRSSFHQVDPAVVPGRGPSRLP